MIDSRSHYTAFWLGWLKGRVNRKEFPRHRHVPYHHAVLCVLGCTRATLMYSCVPLDSLTWCGWCEASGNTGCELEQWLLWRHTDDGRGCYSGYRTQGCIAQWLERLIADQQVRGSIPGGGHGLSS